MKLAGIRVIDLSQFLPGPHLSMMMADHGAEVIAVEPPGGEPAREIGLRQDGESVWFRNVCRGKRSVSLDLKQEAATRYLLRLVETADVVIESFRPGTAARLGFGAEAMGERHPRLVYCSISAFGQTGAKRSKIAHDLSVQADSGAVFLNEDANGEAVMPAMPVADMAGSLMALSGILMALLRRERTGVGDRLDIAMQDSLVAWYPNALGTVFATGRSPIVKNERSWGGAAFYQIYRTSDGRALTLGGSELKFARALLTALGRDDLIDLCRLPPGPGQEPVMAFLRETFAANTLDHWTAFLDGLDLCWAPVRDLAEAMAEEHLAQRGMVLADEAGRRHLGAPIRFAGEPARPVFATRSQGADGPSLARELGYHEDEIAALLEARAMIVA